MSPIEQVVSQAVTNITGLSVDMTTFAVGAIVIFVLLAGFDLILVSLGIDIHSFTSSKTKNKKEFSVKENEDKYKNYARSRYWKEQYKSRYEREFK